jgi:SHAQKYF class myb-like DNA-binding protein
VYEQDILSSDLLILNHIYIYRNFLHGLEVYGRGNWKNISRYFVPTRTPIQICSHAQKYFHRKECTTRKQRFSINDVGLYDTEPWVQKNSSSSKSLAFGRSAYNTNYYDIEGQQAVLNKLTHASQVSSRHVATWTRGQHIIASSSIDPTMVQSNSLGWEALAFTRGADNTNYYDFDGQHNAVNNLACADLASNNQIATWTRGQQTTTSSFVAPTTMQNTSPSWEVLSFTDSAYNTNYYDFDGQQVALNNITRGQPW